MLLPLETGPAWMQVAARFNPLAYVVDAERALFAGQLTSGTVAWGWVAALGDRRPSGSRSGSGSWRAAPTDRWTCRAHPDRLDAHDLSVQVPTAQPSRCPCGHTDLVVETRDLIPRRAEDLVLDDPATGGCERGAK